jgi:hypothetical protein
MRDAIDERLLASLFDADDDDTEDVAIVAREQREKGFWCCLNCCYLISGLQRLNIIALTRGDN